MKEAGPLFPCSLDPISTGLCLAVENRCLVFLAADGSLDNDVGFNTLSVKVVHVNPYST